METYDNLVNQEEYVLSKMIKLKMKIYQWKCNAVWIAILVVLLFSVFGSFVLLNIDGDTVIVAITNFSTLLSIILSISSIAYSYSTSHDTARQFAEIDKTVARMEENNEEMKNNNSQMLNLVFTISKEVHSLHENSLRYRFPDSKINNQQLLSQGIDSGISNMFEGNK